MSSIFFSEFYCFQRNIQKWEAVFTFPNLCIEQSKIDEYMLSTYVENRTKFNLHLDSGQKMFVAPLQCASVQRTRICPCLRHVGVKFAVEVQQDSLLTPALDGGQCSTPGSGRFDPGKEPRYPFDGRLEAPRIPSGHF